MVTIVTTWQVQHRGSGRTGVTAKVKWQVGGGADDGLCPLASGTGAGHPGCALAFPGRLVVPSQDAGGNIVIPGVAFNASLIVPAGARNQLNVTAQLPGSSDARRGFWSSLSFISCVGKKSLIPDWGTSGF